MAVLLSDDDNRDHCQFCGKVETPGPDGLQVRECSDDCGEMVCADCAEVDYDFVGDPGHYRLCSWKCPECLRPTTHALFRPEDVGRLVTEEELIARGCLPPDWPAFSGSGDAGLSTTISAYTDASVVTIDSDCLPGYFHRVWRSLWVPRTVGYDLVAGLVVLIFLLALLALAGAFKG